MVPPLGNVVGSALFYAAIGAVVYDGRPRSVFAAAATVVADWPTLTAAVVIGAIAVGILVCREYRRSEQRW